MDSFKSSIKMISNSYDIFFHNLNIFKFSDDETKLNDIKEELIFQPVIPGVTFPMSEFGVYGFSLFLSTVFHELGHALAADCQDVKILGYGILLFFIIPAAYVGKYKNAVFYLC